MPRGPRRRLPPQAPPSLAPEAPPPPAPAELLPPVNPLWRVKQKPTPPSARPALPPAVPYSEIWAAWTESVRRVRDERAPVHMAPVASPPLELAAPLPPASTTAKPPVRSRAQPPALVDHPIYISSGEESSVGDNYS